MSLRAGLRRSGSVGGVFARGMASLVVVVLLLSIVSTLAVFALEYGMRDRRASEHGIALHLAQAGAQAGLDQGLVFFRARLGDALSSWLPPVAAATGSGPNWKRCDVRDDTPPCADAPVAVRANYFRYAASSDIADGDAFGLDMRGTFVDSDGVPARQLIDSVDGQRVVYTVQALLCLVDLRHPQRQCVPADDAAAPENHPGLAWHGPWSIVLLSSAHLAGTNAQAALRETIASRDGGLPGVIPGSWAYTGPVDSRSTHALAR